ncbi:hypothetical protein HanRHA438_Chr15g0706071 [Helianthus annuus]|uniref:Uncharacterized protein n=1 Tax=Helianthus annuus TaxID=4232 RepID=A0A9K3E027_HELAN|nr:hypothetical protein HanXRQr2_Chr15g0693751 [Helianthus annuus]KAJ0451236.1 hypothetical protein HanHA300_Chr15g0565311 [Helianthus annuus]KAJ0455690.1 hypothetical protein HanIR_Chr15g0754031 [Helianthus annuus]KAJ0473104.1 hypothetical protein HanHA89_Chr15g0614581 [Helianthus annuus]KAJ0629180.1 hypothetical protein HanIR_Chr00c23g0910471 [Helianthus annuus]
MWLFEGPMTTITTTGFKSATRHAISGYLRSPQSRATIACGFIDPICSGKGFKVCASGDGGAMVLIQWFRVWLAMAGVVDSCRTNNMIEGGKIPISVR